jgi:cyclic pyranopterin phosphate synthase
VKILSDKYGRVHNYLRISLTDRCNLNCIYCNPVYSRARFAKKSEILSFEEILRLIKIFAGELGFKKFRFTGGEPLARKGIIGFFRTLLELKEKFGFKTAITTNGTMLYEMLPDLKKYGIDYINISLDSLKSDIFKSITGKDNFYNVIKSIYRAKKIGYDNIKLNCVVMKGINDNEIPNFVRFAVDEDINVRFIEYMPFSNNKWNQNEFISYSEIYERINELYELVPQKESEGAVSKDYLIKNFKGKISFISSISDHFCSSCSRLRLNANGKLRLCLFSPKENEIDLKPILCRTDYTDKDISLKITEYIKFKPKEHKGIDELIKLDLNYMLTNGG